MDVPALFLMWGGGRPRLASNLDDLNIWVISSLLILACFCSTCAYIPLSTSTFDFFFFFLKVISEMPLFTIVITKSRNDRIVQSELVLIRLM